MATKDYRKAEKKKPAKGVVKPVAPILMPPVEVEVARKKGKKVEWGEEES
jgi:hypothetical protein